MGEGSTDGPLRVVGHSGGKQEALRTFENAVAALVLYTPADAHTPGPILEHTDMHVCLWASMVTWGDHGMECIVYHLLM